MPQDPFSNHLSDPLANAAHTCRHCQQIVIDTRIASVDNKSKTKFQNTFQLTAGDVLWAEKDGCLLFQALIQSMDDPLNLREENAETNSLRLGVNIDRAALVDFLVTWELHIVKASVVWRWKDEPEKLQIRKGYTENSDHWIRSQEYLLEIAADDPAYRDATAGRLFPYLSIPPAYPYIHSIATIQVINGWIQECNESHIDCRKTIEQDTYGPSRVLDIGTTENQYLRIRAANQKNSRYAALSYCWGGDDSMQLLRSTLESWKKEIPFFRLPRTVKDAILTTRHLGLQYIWIDRLCIIQDDSEDIARELGVQAEIYRSAYLTISASSSQSSTDGFLQSREIISKHGTVLRYILSDNISGRVVATHGQRFSNSFQDPTQPIENAINSRAWTYQEQKISTRSVGFCSNALTWKCRNGKAIHWQRYKDPKSFSEISSDERIFSENNKITEWEKVVKEYTERKLSFAGDKLVAISAVAKEFAEYLKTMCGIQAPIYLAGLWQHELSTQLCWYASNQHERHPRPAEYRAPSWSWASADGGFINYEPPMPLGPAGVERFQVAEILHCAVENTSPLVPYGAVRSGELRIKGCLVPEIWDRKKQKLRAQKKANPQFRGSPSGHSDAVEENQDSTIPVNCLQLGYFRFPKISGPGVSGDNIFGLILVPVGPVFKRVGFFHTFTNDKNYMGFENCESQVITIL